MPQDNKRVTFEEPGGSNFNRPRGPRLSWPTRMAIKLGLAKDARQASVVLTAIAVLAIILAVIFWPRDSYELVPQPGLSYEQALRG